jgi:hypothetical protein
MNRRHVIALTPVAFLAAGGLGASSAFAQQKSLKEQLVGIWTLVSSDNTAPDGSKRQLFGAKPKGILVLDASGWFSQMNANPDRPKFKANNRLQGTAEENKAVLAGTVALFGKWSVNEADKTLIMDYESSLFPNQDGTEAKRVIVSLTADELKYTTPPSGAGGKTDSVWRRAR